MRKVMLVTFLFAITRVYASGSKEIVNHQVQPRENLFRISLMYNSTVTDIVRENPGLDPDKIRSGSTIRVPKDTKIRDAAFVDALLHGKKPPVHNNPNATPDAAQAKTEEEILNENPFMSPGKQRKSIQQMELESALENNVSQKAFKTSTPEVKVAKNCQTAIAVAGPQNQSTTLVRETPLPVSLFDRQMELLLNGEDPSSIVNTKPVGAAAKPATDDHLPAAGSDCLQNNTPEPAKTAINDNDVQGIDMIKDKIGVADNRNAEILKQLGLLIDANQIIAINLQIVMKDGSVRTISSHDEQKKILAQLVTAN